METIDDETSAAAIDFMKRQQAAGKPFFCWFNSTRMHLRTHVRAEHRGRYTHGDSEYIDGMLEHDDTIGTLLKALDDMGIANNTIVVYTSDNGPHMNTWPDGAMTWFRSEKNTNWEGAFRVPCLVRWPGAIKPGTVTNELMSHNDWIPDALRDRRRAGHRQQAQGRLHGQRHQLQGSPRRLRPVRVPAQRERQRRQQQRHEERPRQVLLLRRRRTARGHAAGRLQVRLLRAALAGHDGLWAEPFTTLRLQKIFNLIRTRSSGPTSRPTPTGTGTSIMSAAVVRVMDEVFKFVATFKEFPPRSFPPSFNPANIMESTIEGIKEDRR